jgi:hypothetical protein
MSLDPDNQKILDSNSLTGGRPASFIMIRGDSATRPVASFAEHPK